MNPNDPLALEFRPGRKVECTGNSWSRLVRRIVKAEGQGDRIPVIGNVYEIEATYPCGCGKCSGLLLKLKGVEEVTISVLAGTITMPDANDFRVITTN